MFETFPITLIFKQATFETWLFKRFLSDHFKNVSNTTVWITVFDLFLQTLRFIL